MYKLPLPLGFAVLSILSVPAAAPLGAQQREADLAPPRAHAGASLDVAHPVGEFGELVDTGFGVSVHLRYPLDAAGVLALRAEGSYVNYGHESRPVLVSPWIGGRITLDLQTDNNILALGVGPQLTAPSGRVRPYLNGMAGYSYFETVSALRGYRSEERFATTRNFGDGAWFYGGGAGVYIPVAHGRIPVMADVGVRFRRTGSVRYLREQDIRDLPGGGIEIHPVQSETELLTFQAGIAVGLRRSEPHRR